MRIVEKHYVREEVACAMGLSFETARVRMQVAHELVHRLPTTLDALADGSISYLHCRTLVEAVHALEDGAVVAKIEERVLERAGTQTVAEFRRSVRRAVLALDPTPQAGKHARAAAEVHCRDD